MHGDNQSSCARSPATNLRGPPGPEGSPPLAGRCPAAGRRQRQGSSMRKKPQDRGLPKACAAPSRGWEGNVAARSPWGARPPPQARAPLFCGPLPPYLQDVLQHVGLHRGGCLLCPASVPSHVPLPAACRPRDGRKDGRAARHQHARSPPLLSAREEEMDASTQRGAGAYHPSAGGAAAVRGCGPSGVAGVDRQGPKAPSPTSPGSLARLRARVAAPRPGWAARLPPVASATPRERVQRARRRLCWKKNEKLARRPKAPDEASTSSPSSARCPECSCPWASCFPAPKADVGLFVASLSYPLVVALHTPHNP